MGKILEGKYEDADDHVQQLFLFAYCDCAIALMDKPPRERAGEGITVEDYFKKLPEIRSALIRVVLLFCVKPKETEQQAAQHTAQQVMNLVTPAVQGGGGGDGNSDQKNKGGRPKNGWNFEQDMLKYYNGYRRIEWAKRRAHDDEKNANHDPMTWYKAAVEEMERVTAIRKNQDAETPSQQQDDEAVESYNQDNIGVDACFSIDAYKNSFVAV